MAFILIFCIEVKARPFFYFIALFDILLYSCLCVMAMMHISKGLEFIFPSIIIGAFLIIVSAAFGKSFHHSRSRYTLSIYYAYLRAFMNYLLILGSIAMVILTLWRNWKKDNEFIFSLVLLAFEVLLDFYWTLELKDAIELLHHNHRLKFLANHSNSAHHKQNEPLV